MGGGLMQLVAYGAQDVYLTGNPQITFFKVVYRRHTNFSMECIQQTINGTSTIGSSSSTGTVTISRNGDLVHKMFISSEIAGITDGESIIKDVEIEIGGQKIDKHTKAWIQIWSELSTPAGKREGRGRMVCSKGHNKTITSNLAGPASSTSRVIVPLEFWFCRNAGLALPLIALQYHEVKLKFNFGTSAATSVGVAAPVELWCDYIYLDTDERRRFAQVSHEYLIEQVQIQQFSASTSLKLNFNHPVKEIIWTELSDTHYGSARIELNGHDRFTKQSPEYFQLKQPYDYHTAIPSQNLGHISGGTQTRDINHEGLLADISEGLNGTAATTITEFNLFVSSAADRDITTANGIPNYGSYHDENQGGTLVSFPSSFTETTDLIKAANFSAQSDGTAATRFLAVNGSAAASPFLRNSIIIGDTYTFKITDDSTGQMHTTANTTLLAIYQRQSDTIPTDGTGCVSANNKIGTTNVVTEMTNTTIKANMIVLEFNVDIFNSTTDMHPTGIALADGDKLVLEHFGDSNYSSELRTGTEVHDPGLSHVTSFQHRINVYSFALKPEEHQPSGTCNFSRIDTAHLMFTTAPALRVTVYAVNYNILRIMSGMGGLAYSN
jgi:hypothetical protein